MKKNLERKNVFFHLEIGEHGWDPKNQQYGDMEVI